MNPLLILAVPVVRAAKRYSDELTIALNQLREKYDIEFTTPTRFYETLNLGL